MAADKEAFDDSVEPIITWGMGEIISSDYKINGTVSLVPTPGHTPGHVSISIESKGEKAIISGDFIHHPAQFVYLDWKMNVNVLPKVADNTRQKLLERLADSDTLLLGSHFANPVVGRVIRGKDGFIFKV